MQYNLITILGPTAAGKTGLAAKLAYKFGGEIISADSRQVYQGLDIGTGKDLSDYTVDGVQVPYHLIDVVSPNDEFNLYQFNKLFYKAYEQVFGENKIPFLVGGTGLFLHSILKGYKLHEVDFESTRYHELDNLKLSQLSGILKKLNPALHNSTDMLIKDRVIKAIIVAEHNIDKEIDIPKIISFVLGIKMERDEIKKSITKRLKERLANGMIEEVERLKNEGVSFDKMLFWGLEYKYIGMYVEGILNYNDMFQKLNSSIHQFAKRQMTWFRKMEKEGIIIHWLNGPDYNAAIELIEKHYFKNTNKH